MWTKAIITPMAYNVISFSDEKESTGICGKIECNGNVRH